MITMKTNETPNVLDQHQLSDQQQQEQQQEQEQQQQQEHRQPQQQVQQQQQQEQLQLQLHQIQLQQYSQKLDELQIMSKLPGKNMRTGPSPLRHLVAVTACIIAFTGVFSLLIIYMDTTALRHQQFRLNMSRDYDLLSIQQDNPTLITFIREIHLKKTSMNFMKNSPNEHLNFMEHHEMVPEMAHQLATMCSMKQNGYFIQSMTGTTGALMTGPWLTETLKWSGLIVEPEPRKYFGIQKQNVHRTNIEVMHACLSPNPYPKEVTVHNDDDDVRINSLLDEEALFNSRVKCFPLYTLILAVNHTNIDLLSLGCQGQELQILKTLPFDKVKISLITIHLEEYDNSRHYHSQQLHQQLEDPSKIYYTGSEYIRNITKFLQKKSYKLVKSIKRNYIFQLFDSIKQNRL